MAANLHEFDCIVEDGFGIPAGEPFGPDALPVDWEEPYLLSDGQPVPILMAFQIAVNWELAQRVARHPYVEKIEPPLGQVPFLDVDAPAPPAHCPRGRESAEGKLIDPAELQGTERKVVAIEIDNRDLPAAITCPDGQATCKAATDAEWERYLLNTRKTTCILRELDAVVGVGEYRDTFTSVSGSVLTPALPPLGKIPSVVNEFGRALTGDESQQIAEHPYVKGVRRLYSGDEPMPPSEDACPLDTSQPVAVRECSNEREPVTGKWSEQDELIWQSDPGPHDVMIVVTGGGKICPEPSCPPRPNECPEQDEKHRYLEQWNWESQRCVRELIETLGGQATDERFWLVNALVARLTSEQIRVVAEHPHVQSITNAVGGPPRSSGPP